MSIGAVIILSGFLYVSAAGLSGTINNKGYTQAKRAAWFCLALGIAVEWIFEVYLK